MVNGEISVCINHRRYQRKTKTKQEEKKNNKKVKTRRKWEFEKDK